MSLKVSVIIVTYNRADFLSRAINSVLLQDFKDFELLIIDDASTDKTESVVSNFNDCRIKYFKNEKNLGISKSRNKGVCLANGEYVAMLDSDDYWLSKDKLTKQVYILESDQSIGIVGTAILCEDERGKFLKKDVFKSEDLSIRRKILLKNQFAQSSVLFRMEAFIFSGGYDENLSVCEDLDLWLKIGLRYKFFNINIPMTAYTIHSNGVSNGNKKIILATDFVIKKYNKKYKNYFLARFKTFFRICYFYYKIFIAKVF